MNLTDLQVELRSIEDHISMLHSEIDKMKPQTDEEKKTDFEAITKLAKQYTISNIGILSAPEVIQKQYIYSLSYLLLTDQMDINRRLLYLCRISNGCKLKISAEDIYKSGLEFEAKDIETLCSDLQEYKYSYLVEAFVIANLSEEASVNMLSIMANIAKIMGCDKEEIRVIGQVAKSRLLNDLNIIKQIPIPSKNRWSGKFNEYITKEWIIKQRIDCGIICIDKYDKKYVNSRYGSSVAAIMAASSVNTSNSENDVEIKHPCVIKKRLQAGSLVKNGDSILEYEEEVKKKSKSRNGSSTGLFATMYATTEEEIVMEERNIKASCDGVVFFVDDYKKGSVSDKKDKYVAVYIVSYFDEYSDFSKWYTNEK